MTNQIAQTVFVIDDDEALNQSLCWLLQSTGLNVKAYLRADAFLADFEPQQRGCLLIDIRMPGMSGLELQEQLNSLNNQMPIIMMTAHGDIPIAVRAIKAGAMEFITKPCEPLALIEMIKKALQKDSLRLNTNDDKALQQRFASLTTREQQILQGIVNGKLNKQIAADLNISIKTVEMHRANLMQKLKIHTVAELVSCYLKLRQLK